MKKTIVIFLTGIMLLTLAACGNQAGNTATPTPISTDKQAEAAATAVPQSEPVVASNESSATTSETGSNMLIAYFTMPETNGVDAVSGASRVIIDDELLGNTQYIAQVIAQQTNGELYQIETVQEYPGTHAPLLQFANDEKSKDARPKLSSKIENMDDYDVIFIGFPNWWADMPMPVYTFLDEYDLSGKTIVPFSTHGGSGFSSTIDTITEMEPDATVTQDGFTVSRNSVADAEKDVSDWIESLGL